MPAATLPHSLMSTHRYAQDKKHALQAVTPFSTQVALCYRCIDAHCCTCMPQKAVLPFSRLHCTFLPGHVSDR